MVKNDSSEVLVQRKHTCNCCDSHGYMIHINVPCANGLDIDKEDKETEK